MTKRFSGARKLAAISLAVAAAVMSPLSASAHDWDHDGGWGHRGGEHHGWDRGGDYRGDYRHGGGYWNGGRWIAGAIVTGAVAGIISDALRPAPVYYEQPRVVYRDDRVPTVIYEDAPIIEHRVVTRTVVYDNGYPTRYVRDDGDDD